MLSTPSALQWLVETGTISKVVRIIKSGKESQIYLTKRVNEDRVFYFAAKVHKARTQRSFKGDKIYRDGWCLEGRIQRAVSRGTRYGRRVVESLWVTQEFNALKRLWKHKADVPTPILRHDNVILMTYVGDPDQPAPKLSEIRLNPREATQAFNALIENLRILIRLNLVHGDLSPFNVLYWKGKIWIIDLPQAVDLHTNPHAMDLLYRDLQYICRYFLKHHVQCTPEDLFSQLLHLPYIPHTTYHDLLLISAESSFSAKKAE